MTTAKALVAGLAVTLGLLAVSYGLEGIAQLAGPEEVEVHSEESETHAEEEAEEIELGDEEDNEEEAEEDHEG